MAKRYKHLYEQIVTFENLWQAYRKARKGKRQKQGVSAFEFDLENELLSIQEALLKELYEFSGYHTFTIYEPAQRQISAAPFRDRVVHHAICSVIEPLLDKAKGVTVCCAAAVGTMMPATCALPFASAVSRTTRTTTTVFVS